MRRARLHRTLQAIRATGAKAGLALNPGTPIEAVEYLLDLTDLICVMTVTGLWRPEVHPFPESRKSVACGR